MLSHQRAWTLCASGKRRVLGCRSKLYILFSMLIQDRRPAMADDTRKPTDTTSATAPEKPAVAAEAKPSVTKPAARPRSAKSVVPTAASGKPVRAPAKTTKAPAKNTLARPSPEKKSPAAKKVAHEPEPFVATVKNAGKPPKNIKAKLIRDSFTMPEGEYALIANLKKRCLDAGVPAKKSEILRAAVANLAKLSDSSLVATVRRLEAIKTGRPAKAKGSK
ncbi:MAG: hypothetical protein ACM3Z4_02010 [Hyphomicrobiales bacterium]